jgi:hypothetical protein
MLELAASEAIRLGHPSVGTEHLLLALAREESGRVATLLRGFQVPLERVRQEVLKLLTRGEGSSSEREVPMTPRGRRALELALEEARGLGQDSAGAEHVLLGLIREGEGIAAMVLRSLGVRGEVVRARISSRPASADSGGAPDATLPTCVTCHRRLDPRQVVGGDHSKIALLLPGQVLPLRCDGCSNHYCSACMTGPTSSHGEVAVGRCSLICPACHGALRVQSGAEENLHTESSPAPDRTIADPGAGPTKSADQYVELFLRLPHETSETLAHAVRQVRLAFVEEMIWLVDARHAVRKKKVMFDILEELDGKWRAVDTLLGGRLGADGFISAIEAEMPGTVADWRRFQEMRFRARRW